MILNKEYNSNSDTSLLDLQSAVKKTCGQKWEGQSPCSPEVFPIRCHKNKCQEGIPKSAKPFTFSNATIQSACAPHDATSVMILFRGTTGEFPILSVNLWGADKFQHKEGTYRLSGKPSMDKKFQSSYCFHKGSCQFPKEVTLKIVWARDEGHIEFSFLLEDGDKIEGKTPLKFIKSSTPVLCG